MVIWSAVICDGIMIYIISEPVHTKLDIKKITTLTSSTDLFVEDSKI